MNRQASRRKVRKRKSSAQNSRVKFRLFLGIIVMAVFLGFLTARFVVGPLIGYDADESPARIAGEKSEQNEDADEEKAEESERETGTVPEKGYALQFGAFSTEAAAQDLAANLKGKGIKTEIIRVDDVYKVISPLIDTKEGALKALSDLPEHSVSDVFIASFQ